MADRASNSDEITRVLLQCEERLRLLQAQGRLTADALTAFVDLTAQVRREMERRSANRANQPPPTIERREAATSGVARDSQE